MAVVSLSKIQIRRGRKLGGTGLPQLASGELAWAIDTRELYIGNGAVAEGAPAVGNTKILTEHDILTGINDQLTYVYINSNTTLEPNTSYITDSSGGTFMVALPFDPEQGQFVVLADGADWTASNVTVDRNGSTIEGDINDLLLDVGETIVTFIYDGTTWQVLRTTGPRGYSGYSGSPGSNNLINAVNDNSTNPLYPVMVNAAGVAASARVSTGKIYFNASTGTIYATAKSFNIPHPTKPGKNLVYGSLEGPENAIYIRGRTQTGIVELPEYWNKLVDTATTTVQLTANGKFNNYFVKEINETNVIISTDSESNVIDCFYLILAERKDIPKLETEVRRQNIG